jgi:hypothetical protein
MLALAVTGLVCFSQGVHLLSLGKRPLDSIKGVLARGHSANSLRIRWASITEHRKPTKAEALRNHVIEAVVVFKDAIDLSGFSSGPVFRPLVEWERRSLRTEDYLQLPWHMPLQDHPISRFYDFWPPVKCHRQSQWLKIAETFAGDRNIELGISRRYQPTIDERFAHLSLVLFRETTPRWGEVIQGRSLSTNQLLPHQSSLFLNFAQSLVGCFSRSSVSAIYPSRIERVDNQKNDTNKFRNKFRPVPAIALFVAGNLVLFVGWWNLHFRSDSWRMCTLWTVCFIGGILISLLGGWYWLIVHGSP